MRPYFARASASNFVKKMKDKFVIVLFLACVGLIAISCGGIQSAATGTPILPPAAPIASDEAANDVAIRFLENKIKNDSEDFGASNKLAGLYLQKLRETGNVQYLELANRAARASLSSVPEVRNVGGLAALALSEIAAHDFAAARDHALKLIELQPRKSYPQGILGDALLELGEYERAEIAYKKIIALDGGIGYDGESRLARLAQLKGDNAGAQKHFAAALSLALGQSAPLRETVAWLRWQSGETAFSVGEYENAEKHYRDSLTTFPDYHRAVASLGRVRAARNDLTGAIEQYEKAVRLLPDPNYVAALGDLYKIVGRDDEAKKQYELVEQIGRLSQLNGALYNRQLALFYADHDLKTEESYKLALREYEARKDVYGADALAWTALKVGKIAEAQAAIKDALRLGTNDAKLFYHAALIARASGDESAARDFLQRALKLNPQFDPLQSAAAKTLPESL
jgi:tetratricopeptide (TPR) repeat protein